MNKQIGILTTHGMGREKPRDYEKVVDAFKQRLFDQLNDDVKQDLHFQPIYYQDQMQIQQELVWGKVRQGPLAGFGLWHWLRQFMLYYFSDAATYQYKPDVEGNVYLKVHQAINTAIDNLYNQLGNQDSPVVLVAHSLGCHIISNHIWDAQNGRGIWQNQPPTGFQQLDTLRYLFTTGCNIPLFVAGLEDIFAIGKPNNDFQWINYYDKDDPLGWPLQPLSEAYNQLVQDVAVNTGFTPLGHTKYWQSRTVIKSIAEKITALHASL
jgi:hypothetical protein